MQIIEKTKNKHEKRHAKKRFLKLIFLDFSRGLFRLFVISHGIFSQAVFFVWHFSLGVMSSFRFAIMPGEKKNKRKNFRQKDKNSKETPREKTKSATQKDKICLKCNFFTLHFFLVFFLFDFHLEEFVITPFRVAFSHFFAWRFFRQAFLRLFWSGKKKHEMAQTTHHIQAQQHLVMMQAQCYQPFSRKTEPGRPQWNGPTYILYIRVNM